MWAKIANAAKSFAKGKAKEKTVQKLTQKSDGENLLSKINSSVLLMAAIPLIGILLIFIAPLIIMYQAYANIYVIQAADPHYYENSESSSSSSSSISSGTGTGLPDDKSMYPLNGKKNGKKLPYLEKDGKNLTKAEFKELAKYIYDNVNKESDWGRRVAAAGWSLAYGLYEKGMMLHYRKSGKFSSSSRKNIINHKWGQYVDESEINRICSPSYPNGRYINHGGDCGSSKHKYEGMDCDGFTSWAQSVGCGKNVSDSGPTHTSDFSKAEPGDIIVCNHHVILFLKQNGDGSFMTVEESTVSSIDGLYFKKRKADNSYFKSANCRVSKYKKVYKKYCKKKKWNDVK